MSKRNRFTESDGFSVSGTKKTLPSDRHSLRSARVSGRMCLSAEQHSQIASAYEVAAADETLPSQLRAAFVKKAKWFRMLYQIEVAKLSAGFLSAVVGTAPKRGYLSLAEKLSRARGPRGVI
jgi:hypothetical protein